MEAVPLHWTEDRNIGEGWPLAHTVTANNFVDEQRKKTVSPNGREPTRTNNFKMRLVAAKLCYQ